MQRRIVLLSAILITLLLGGQTPSPIQQKNFQHDLDALTKRGFTYRMLDNDVIELTDPVSGTKRLKSLREPNETTIRAWAAQRGIPILEIDPATIDTSKYTGWYKYWATVPLSNWPPLPLVVGDVNRNNKADVYGLFWDNGIFRNNVYEVDSAGVVSQAFEFISYQSTSVGLSDFDANGLFEINYAFSDSLYTFEQTDIHSLPTRQKFVFSRLGDIITKTFIGQIDSDSLPDYLYRAFIPDSGGNFVTAVAEYRSDSNNLNKVWSSTIFGNTDAFLGGYEVGDFDGDGRKDFVSSDLFGHVLVAEHVKDDSFTVVWRDSIPFVNAYYVGSGDVDNDGKQEFFVGATVGNGDWTTMFEADSDNQYSPKLVIHLLSGGTFDEMQYLATDVDGTGMLELVICAGADIYMFKSNQDNQYYLWYLKRENARDGIQFYDFNKDGRKDFIVSKAVYVDPPGYFRNYADIYVATPLVTVGEANGTQFPERLILYPNYPNPFNPSTVISYDLPMDAHVALKVYDVLGREVMTLVNGVVEAGYHQTILNATNLASGLYFYRLQAGAYTSVKKLMLLK